MNQTIRQNSRLLCVLLAACVLIGMLCSCAAVKEETPADSAKAVTVTVTVVGPDQKSEDFTLKTEKATLADAMREAGLIGEDTQSGFYDTVNGVKADYNKDKSWWCITKDGAMTEVGLNDLVLADGDHYTITYTVS